MLISYCLDDGLSGRTCSQKVKFRSNLKSPRPTLNSSDILIFLLVGTSSQYDILKWWLKLVHEPLDIVLVSDPCILPSIQCNDSSTKIAQEITLLFPLITIHIIRANLIDTGYLSLSCKLRTGASLIYKQFPNKKVYLKIDTDTILFPDNLLRLSRTLDYVHDSTKPFYYGMHRYIHVFLYIILVYYIIL